ncbi:MAG: helix-turn-helix domain-containing protein, partial [Exiguobacterium sp.]
PAGVSLRQLRVGTIREDVNLTVCYEVGFQTPSNFYRVFRQVKGCTPNTYRKGEDL